MIKVIDILMYILVFSLSLLVCSKNPGEPEPDPPEEVPCDTVFVESVRIEGVYEIFYIQDPSRNTYGLLQNDVSIFQIITPSSILEEVRVEVPGNYKQGDTLETSASGSKSRIRFAFHVNE